MLTTHKAIETRYAGCRFRSRLEARWACFLDACKIEWQYEPQGYDLSDVYSVGPQRIGRYLPDFWLPRKDAWLEIKGCLPQDHFLLTLEESEMFGLVGHTKAKIGYIFYGPPDYESRFACCHWKDGRLDIFRNEGLDLFYDEQDLMEAAIDAAKSARFEFGESGAG